MTLSAQKTFIDQVQSLPPLPAVVHRILEVTNSPDSSAEDVSEALSGDQAIAAKILRVANSPFYGLGRQISQLSRAVVLLGTRAVRNMVLGICARDTLTRGADQSPEHAAIWQHSIAVAAASDLIARKAGLKVPEEAFVAGLLHDTGQLAMAIFQPDSFRTLFRQRVTGQGFLALEREQFGVDHTEAGFRILTAWRLPEKLCRVAQRHHRSEIDSEDSPKKLLPVVMLADTMAHVMGMGLDTRGEDFCAARASQVLGLSESDVLEVFAGLEQRIEQVVEMLATKPEAQARLLPKNVSQRVVWITPEGVAPCCLRRQLLEQLGYRLTVVSPRNIPADLCSDDLILISAVGVHKAAASALALRFAQRGHRRVVMLCRTDDPAPVRQRDEKTGVCRLALSFTARDIQWLQETLQP